MTKVPLAVLATILSEKRKSEEDLAAERKKAAKQQPKDQKVGKGKDAANPKAAAVTEPKPKAMCNLFKSKDGCKYGDKCKFSHTA
jgi:hypothetical protein